MLASTRFFASFLVLLVVSSCECRRPKTIALFGIAGVGKSTVSNCLLNQDGAMERIVDGPFPVCEDCGSGNVEFQMRANEQFNIIDSIGFGSPDFDASYILAQMRGVLNKVNNELDCVVYVIKKGRLTNETYQFIRTFQQEVFKGTSKYNSVLVVNKCEKGWVEKDAQRANPFMQLMLESVNFVTYELDLKWDHWSDSNETKRSNVVIRQRAIDNLVDYLANLPFERISVKHIQTAEFERTWLKYIYAFLEHLASNIINGVTSLFTGTNTIKGDVTYVG